MNEKFLKERLVNNLKGASSNINHKTSAIVEALNYLDRDREWTKRINTNQIKNMITNSINQDELINNLVEALSDKREIKKPLNESVEPKQKLNEATSNFDNMIYLPLLAFYVYDEDRSEDSYGENVCILDNSQVEDLVSDIVEFNDETKEIAYELDIDEDGNQMYGDNLNLEDITLEADEGYYDGAYIRCNYEKSFDYLDEDVKKAQIERFTNFLNEMKKKYGLTQLKVGARFSNGETLYDIVEKLKESEDGEDRVYIYQLPNDINLNYLRQSINLTSANSIKLVGEVNQGGDQPGDILISGTKADLEKFADDYFDYTLNPDYLYKENDFDTDLIEPLSMEYSWEENLKEGYDPIYDALKGSGKSPIFEFDDGTVYGVEYEDGKLYAGSISNTGLQHKYEIEYDNDFSVDVNLQNLYDKIIESEPELLGEGLDDKVTYVIYKENGKYKGTPKSNYDAQVRDANMVQDYKEFKDANQIIDYLTKYTKNKDKSSYKVIDENLNDTQNLINDAKKFAKENNKDVKVMGVVSSNECSVSTFPENFNEMVKLFGTKFDVYDEDEELERFKIKTKSANENLKEDKDSGKILQRKMGAKFMPPRDYGIKKKSPRYVYEVYWYTDEDCSGDPIFKKFPSNKAREQWYEQHKDDPDKFSMCADLDGYNVNENYDVTIKDKKTGETKTLKNRTDNQLDRLEQNRNIEVVSTEPIEKSLKESKKDWIRVKYDDAWYIVDENTNEEIDGPFDTLKQTEDASYGHLEYVAPRSDENLKENKLQEKNDYFAYLDKDYADLLDSDVNVYDIKSFVEKESNGEYTTHYTDKYAIIVCANGKGCVVDYEAVGQDFDNVDSEIRFGIVENKDNEYTDEQGVKHRTISLVATHNVKTTPREVMGKAPKETMKYRDFFRKYNYNDRCAYNFKDLAKYISANNGIQEGCKTKKKLKEGYIGQTLYDFLNDCIDPDLIENVNLWGEDDVVYEGDYEGAIDEYGDNEFIEFDCGMDKVVINVDTSEQYQISDYYVDVQDFIEFFNGDEIEVYDLNSGETLFSGYKEDCPDDVLEKIFISFDAPKFISINIEEYDSGDDFDESLKEDTIKQGGKWVNKGNKGDTHGEFKTKKEADAQRKAMFVNKKANAKWGK